MKKPLRIFTCLTFDTEPSLWHRQFPDTLRAMGHDVVLVEDVGLSASWWLTRRGVWDRHRCKRLTAAILTSVETAHQQKPVDLFFAYLYPFQFEPSLLDEVKAMGIPVAFFFCDNLSHPDVAAGIAPHATLNWVPEKAALPQFVRAGAAAIHLPMAANPAHNFPVAAPEEIEVSFAGLKNPFRRALLGEVIALGLPVTIFGGGWIPDMDSHVEIDLAAAASDLPAKTPWHRFREWGWFKLNAARRLARHGLAPRRAEREYSSMGKQYEVQISKHALRQTLNLQQLNALYSRSSVSIGINDQFLAMAQPPLYFYPKMREFEATMSGACYLTQATSESADLFDVGREIECYSTAAELVDRGRELLSSPAKRKEMRIAARKRALGEHTWQHRFEALFARLGL